MHIYWTGRPAQFLRTEGAPLENGKFYRIPTIIVLGILVFSTAWVEGCGGLLGSGSGGNFSLTGTVVDSSTKNPISGALVVLEQADANGIDRVVAAIPSAANGTFGFKPSASGTYDVVADATVTPASGPSVTYAATVTYGVPATANLGQIPLVSVSGNSNMPGSPVILTNTVTSSGAAGGVAVDVTLSALQTTSVVSLTAITIPVFLGSTPAITTGINNPSCNGAACAPYSLLVPSGNFSSGTFSASGTQYTLSTQQSPVSYVVEGKAFAVNAPASPRCTSPTMSSTIVITNGTPGPADREIAFTGCL
jgi:hypothetical protein